MLICIGLRTEMACMQSDLADVVLLRVQCMVAAADHTPK